MTRNTLGLTLLVCASLCGLTARAGVVTNLQEDFTGTTTQNAWYYFNGACLTASTVAAASAHGPGTPPGCTADTYYNESLVGGYNGVAGGTQTLPDLVGEGALRFTNGCTGSGCGSGGYNQNGAIISADTFSTSDGLDITFKTVSYRGNSDSIGGGISDGADGMSFFLVDATGDANSWSPTTDPIGSYGGSLGYTCSNTNSGETEPYHGMIGGFLGLGIDEFGNFLNAGDNTASGFGPHADRIGLRGAGNIAWPWLTANYPADYPSTLTSTQQAAAVQLTCRTGKIWDYALNPSSPTNTGISVLDYQAIPNAYALVPNVIANEYATRGYSRAVATPITYRVKITDNGLLSFWYSYNGGAWQGVIKNQSITQTGEALPSLLRFGFAGSTGGGTNIHELLCFKATPATESASSGNINQQVSSRLQTGTQMYLAYYDPSNWTGRITANAITENSSNQLVISSVAYWDASCVLTGIPAGSSCSTTGQSGAINPESPASRVMLTWNDSTLQGIPFEWSNLSANEQNELDAGDGSATDNRLEYLRGDRSNEITSSGTGLYRDRDSVLGDIVDASPDWIGPPAMRIYNAYENPYTWKDKLYPTAVMPESATGAQSYTTFASDYQTRLNVVYVGANDGFVHGFAAGAYDSSGNYVSSENTGEEVLAYMPQAVLADIHNSTTSNLDYSNAQYGHNFYVDASPADGDLFYNGTWHTWLVGGLGAGGADIYALDVTDPSKFSEANASSLVIGDWTPSTLTCPNQTVTACGVNLGNTYGTPVIRRLHDGHWAIIFGNGIGSSSGDAGIYILEVGQSGANVTITPYYFSTGESGTHDGIAYVSPVDMDGDHITDYVYAGDVNGNVWRFDLTGNSPSSWGVTTAPNSTTPMPIFTTPSGQPITSAVQPAFVTNTSTNQTQMMLMFGTGQKFAVTNSSPTTYASGTQSFYGVWDWDLAGWNAHNLTQFMCLYTSSTATIGGCVGSTSTTTVNASQLVLQSIGVDTTTGQRTIGTPITICWAGTTTCTVSTTNPNNQFGWYINLPGTNSAYSQTTNEQDIYNPTIIGPAVVFNSVLPGIDSPLICTAGTDEGWTYAIDPRTGGALPNFFNLTPSASSINNGNVYTLAYQSNATGTDTVIDGGYSSAGANGNVGSGGTNGVTSGTLVYQTTSGTGGTQGFQYSGNAVGSRQTWIELR